MATRTERVVLELQSNISTVAAKDAAAVALLKRELSGLDGSTRSSSSSTRTLEQDLGRLGTRADSNGKTIDKLSGRLELFAHAALALGPALVPIGAASVPLLSAAASGLGFAAAGAGVTELAFKGLGSALTAFNKASLEPTAANIAAAQLALDKLPPSTQRLVVQLHALNPEFDKLRQAAAAGFAPGVSDGLHALISDAPIVRKAVRGIGDELGNLSREAGQSLASNQWQPFLRFVGNEAPRELDIMGRSVGNVAHGLVELWMAFTPLNQSTGGGILRLSQEFDAWATAADKSKDFQSFIQYVQENGPRVVQLLGDTAHLFVDIVQAAAPLGGPTLKALDLIVKALDLIASSPLATPLLALAQINSVLKLTSTGLRGVGINADLNLKGKITEGAKAASGALFSVVTAQERATMTAGQLAARQEENRAALLKTGAVVAGFALASSGAADAMGLQNTTMLALAGSMAGPWGAAAGGAVGLAMDWKASLDADKASMDGVQASVDRFAASNDILGLGKMAAAGGQLNAALGDNAAFGDKITAQTQVPIAAFDKLSGAISRFNTGLTGSDNPITKLSDLQTVATRMQPQMLKLGITFDDMLNMDPSKLAATVDHMARMATAEDSAAGRSHAVREALNGLNDDMQTTASSASTLSDALDGLFSPLMNLDAARNSWTEALHSLHSQLDTNSKAILGNSDAALKNQDVVRGMSGQLLDLLKAQAASGKSSAYITNTYKTQRAALINTATQLGVNKQALEVYLHQIGLTPKAISTLVRTTGIPESLSQIRQVQAALAALRDKTIRVTTLHTTGGRSTGGFDTGGFTGRGGHLEPAGIVHRNEVVLPEPVVKRDWSFLKSRYGYLPGFDAGGVVGATSTPNDPVSSSLRKALADWKQTLTDDRAARQSLIQKERDLASAVTDSFRSDIFAQSAGVWGASGGFDPLGVLRSDIGNARRFDSLIHGLKRRGLDGGALASIERTGSVQDAQMLSTMNDRRLREFGHLFRERQRVTGNVGEFAGMSVYGDRLAAIHGEITRTNAHLRVLQAEVRRVEHAAGHTGPTNTGKALNNVAATAGKRVKR